MRGKAPWSGSSTRASTLANPDFQTNSGDAHRRPLGSGRLPESVGQQLPDPAAQLTGIHVWRRVRSIVGINAATCGPFSYSPSTGLIPVPHAGWRCGVQPRIFPVPEEDCDGHGTHVAGIAASVRTRRPPGEQRSALPRSWTSSIVKNDGNLAHIVDGVAYIFKVAASRGEPASVNISLGTNVGPHDGSDIFEIDARRAHGSGKACQRRGW